MSILELLGFKRKDTQSRSQPDAPGGAGRETEAIRQVMSQLEALGRERARFLAAFAYVLNRVANADSDISDVEVERMEQIVAELGQLPRPQAALVVQLAKGQQILFGHTADFLVTKEFKELASQEEREHLLDCVLSVSAADDSITSEEEAVVSQIASELGFTHKEFVKARLAYSDKREVLKSLKK